MRGVYQGFEIARALDAGSSPHARGLLELTMNNGAPLRIIPACAGFTMRFYVSSDNIEDHPRMRGVYA